MPKYRKRTLSNIALATDLKLTPSEIYKLAKQSFQNLTINCLEYPKLAKMPFDNTSIICENPEVAEKIYQTQGMIFFCAHQANWEVLFLDGTKRMQGMAIGKKIQNPYLHQWITSIRERFGGKVILPQRAIREGLRFIQNGGFLGIVGDQGMPDSSFYSNFLGNFAWSNPAPALLAYKANCPILFAAIKRTKKGYSIYYHPPVWPNVSLPLKGEVSRMMHKLLSTMEKSILQKPSEWLWQHNRWKKQTLKNIYKPFRLDAFAIILPTKETLFQKISKQLPIFRKIYPLEWITLFIPAPFNTVPPLQVDECIAYHSLSDTLRKDYRFKMLFNLTDCTKISQHYQRFSVMQIVDLPMLQLEESNIESFSIHLQKLLCRTPK